MKERLKLTVKLKLKAIEKVNGYEVGETILMTNDIFATTHGIAYHSIDKGWDIVSMELIEYKPLVETNYE